MITIDIKTTELMIMQHCRHIEGKTSILYGDQITLQGLATFQLSTAFCFRCCQGEQIRLLQDNDNDRILLALNISRGLLYVCPQLNTIIHQRKWMNMVTLAKFFSVLILLLMAWQFMVDGELFWRDLLSTGWKLAVIILSVAGLHDFFLRLKHGRYADVREIFSEFQCPVPIESLRQHVQLRNSYFEQTDNLNHLYDLRDLTQKNGQLIQDAADLKNVLTERDIDGLLPTQREAVQLITLHGHILNHRLSQVPFSSVDTDPYLEFRAELNGKKIYGYFDEFDLDVQQQLEVVISKYPDEKGHYIWAISDLTRFVYLDEDQPFSAERERWAGVIVYGAIIAVFLLGSLVLLPIIGFSEWWAFTSVSSIALIIVLVFCEIVSQMIKKWNQPKHDAAKQAIGRIVYDQLCEQMTIFAAEKFEKIEQYRIYTHRRKRPSRTGYDLKQGL